MKPALNKKPVRSTERSRSDLKPIITFEIACVAFNLPAWNFSFKVSGNVVNTAMQFSIAMIAANQNGVVAPNQPGV